MVPLEFNVSLNGVGGLEVFLSKDALRGNRSTDLKKKKKLLNRTLRSLLYFLFPDQGALPFR